MELQLTFEVLVLFFFVAVIAGIIDTLAGGGGLIVLPTMLLVQVPILSALATNKLQGSFGTFTACIALLKKRAIRWSTVRPAFYTSLIGATSGTILIHFINTDFLEWCIPVVLIVIAMYFALTKKVNQTKVELKVSPKSYLWGVVPVIGFYDGALGPGTGSFFSFANVALMGKSIIEATVEAKFLNFASNIAALIVFIFGGQIIWLLGTVMILGQIIGAAIGSHLILSQGGVIIRPLIVVVCLAMCAFFLWQKLL